MRTVRRRRVKSRIWKKVGVAFFLMLMVGSVLIIL